MADYPLLYGHSSNGCKELRGIEEVADYIVKEGLQSDLMITTPFVLSVIGVIFLYKSFIRKMDEAVRKRFISLEKRIIALENVDCRKN